MSRLGGHVQSFIKIVQYSTSHYYVVAAFIQYKHVFKTSDYTITMGLKNYEEIMLFIKRTRNISGDDHHCLSIILIIYYSTVELGTIQFQPYMRDSDRTACTTLLASHHTCTPHAPHNMHQTTCTPHAPHHTTSPMAVACWMWTPNSYVVFGVCLGAYFIKICQFFSYSMLSL